MKSLFHIGILLFFCALLTAGWAQTNQTVSNGQTTTPVNFPGGGCTYQWTNNTPGIGLPTSGTGNIPAFTAVNSSGSQVTANITATPQSDGFSYIINHDSNNVSVIDNETGTVIATIAVGTGPTGIALSPDGNKVYVTNQNTNNISVINTSTNMVINSIPAGAFPAGIVINSAGSRIYVTNYFSNTVSVINTSTNSVIATINVGASPSNVVISPDNTKVYVTNYMDGTVSVISTATNTVTATINLFQFDDGEAISPDGSKLYVLNNYNNTVTVINTATNTAITSFLVGSMPSVAAISPDGSRLYVTNFDDNTVSVINTATNTIITTIPVGRYPYSISVNPNGSQVYVSNSSSNNVSVINTSNNSVIATINVGSNPSSLGNFISAGPGCNSNPINFTITVNSGPTPVVTTSTVTGSILGCVGSPGESPNVAQFTVAGTSLTGDITVTPPVGFDISLTAVGGYSPSLVLKQAGGAVISTTIYVRSSASDPVGPVSGNVQITTPGASPDQVAVTGVVHALPTVDPVPNFVYNNGAATAPINFTGMGNTFTYTNNNPPIGFPASGQGDISSFIATNNGNAPLIATFTVIPSYSPIAYIASNRSSDVVLWSTPAIFPEISPATINLGQGPWGVSLSPDYSKVYISNSNSGTVSVINTSTNIVIATITVGSVPEGVLVSRDGNNVYVANEASGTVSVISTSTNLVTATILVGKNPTQMAASPDGKLIYVSNHDPQGTISVINTVSNTVAATIGSLNYPTGLAISPDGSKLYVASDIQNNVTIINTANYSVITTIPTGLGSTGVAITPDGSQLFISNSGTYSVSVINTATNTVSTTVGVGKSPSGICVSPDGRFVCVADAGNGNGVCFINTSTYAAICGTNADIPPGAADNPLSYGNFIMPAVSCTGTPITFTITVNPPPPVIKASPATGNMVACVGLAARSPHLEQITVSGSGLTGDILAVASPGFEVSFIPTNGFGNTVSIPQLDGIVPNTIIYVRSTASLSTGSTSGDVIFYSPGATNQDIAVSGIVSPPPVVNQVANQSVNNGSQVIAISFTGTGGTYTWTNDTPSIGLPAEGSGNIASFTAVNSGASPVMATITVTPEANDGTDCSGTPTTFTITVNPPPPPVITSSGTLTGLSTIYGTASSSESFTVSATNATAGILVTPPKGFEVSTDDQTFSTTVTAGQAGAISAVPVYIRLAATTVVGNYSGNIVLSTTTAPDVNVNMPLSTVEKAILTVTAPDVTRAYGVPNPAFVPQYLGFVNGDNQSNLTTLPNLTTTATITSPPGNYPIQVTGGSSPNYIINPVDGTLTITPSPSEIIVPNAFTPNGDGINDFWDIKTLADFPQCLVSVYTRYGNLVFQSRGYPKPWDGTSNGSPVPTGTYYYIINPNQSGFGLLSGFVAVLR